MSKVIDLHLHTIASDGTFTATEIVEKTKSLKLDAIAITDHDSVEALDEARTIARKLDIEIITGIELSAYRGDTEVHILGYYFDDKDPAFLKELRSLCSIRNQRIFEIVERLRFLKLDITVEDIFQLAGKGAAGRLHVARALVGKKIVKNTYEAFKRYLTPGMPAYVEKEKLSTQAVIDLLLSVGGVPVLAHPGLMRGADELIPKLVEEGLRGIEAYHSEHTNQKKEHYYQLAKEYKLVVTGGSDCHGMAKGRMLLGTVRLPYEILEPLRQASRSYEGKVDNY